MKRILIIILAYLFSAYNATSAENAERFKIKKGETYDICKYVHSILEAPENKDFNINYKTGTDFVIPEREPFVETYDGKTHLKYRRPKWTEVPLEEYEKYEKFEFKLDIYRKNHSQGYKIYKTKINFDNYHPSPYQTMLKVESVAGFTCQVAFEDYRTYDYLLRFNNRLYSNTACSFLLRGKENTGDLFDEKNTYLFDSQQVYMISIPDWDKKEMVLVEPQVSRDNKFLEDKFLSLYLPASCVFEQIK